MQIIWLDSVTASFKKCDVHKVTKEIFDVGCPCYLDYLCAGRGAKEHLL